MHHRAPGFHAVLLPWSKVARCGAVAALALSMTTTACSSTNDPGTAGPAGGTGGASVGGQGGKASGGNSASGGSGAGQGGGGQGGGGSGQGGGSAGSSAGSGGGAGQGMPAGTGGAGAGGAGTGGAGGAGDAGATEAGAEVPVRTGPMVLTSSVFAEGQVVARKYRCRTENVSPPLSWTPGPEGTLSYAVTMYHSRSVHWMMWDIPASTTSLPEGIMRVAEPPVPAGAKQVKPAVDGSTWYGYSGPCPGSPNQSYQYYVYALKVAKLPAVTTESAPTAIDTALQANKLERAQLNGMASP